MIWEARGLAEAVVDLRLPQCEEGDLVQALRNIEMSAITLRGLSYNRVVVGIESLIDVFDLVRKGRQNPRTKH